MDFEELFLTEFNIKVNLLITIIYFKYLVIAFAFCVAKMIY